MGDPAAARHRRARRLAAAARSRPRRVQGSTRRSRFDLARRVLDGDFPTVGLRSSVGARNPPLFVYLTAIPLAVRDDPLAATAFVGVLAVAAVILTYFVLRPRFGASRRAGRGGALRHRPVGSPLRPQALGPERAPRRRRAAPLEHVRGARAPAQPRSRASSRSSSASPSSSTSRRSPSPSPPSSSCSTAHARCTGGRSPPVSASRRCCSHPGCPTRSTPRVRRCLRARLGRAARRGAPSRDQWTRSASPIRLIGVGDWDVRGRPTACRRSWRMPGRAGRWRGARAWSRPRCSCSGSSRACCASPAAPAPAGAGPGSSSAQAVPRERSCSSGSRASGSRTQPLRPTALYPHYLIVTFPVSFAVQALALADLVAVARSGVRRVATVGAIATLVMVSAAYTAFTLSFHRFLDDVGGTAGDYGVVYRDKAELADSRTGARAPGGERARDRLPRHRRPGRAAWGFTARDRPRPPARREPRHAPASFARSACSAHAFPRRDEERICA